MRPHSPTPYSDVNRLLADLLDGLRLILQRDLAGVYLYGSLALGGFKPGRSDVDFLAAVSTDLSIQQFEGLRILHHDLASRHAPWGAELEGAYIPLRDLRVYDPTRAVHAHLDRQDELRMEKFDTDWVVQRWVLRERGLRLFGPPASALIDPISPSALIDAVRELFFFWWDPMLADPFRLRPAGYQVYAVLTMPRILYTLRWGAIVSKPAGIQWALENIPAIWSDLLQAALAWQEGQPFDHLEETKGLIAYTAAVARL